MDAKSLEGDGTRGEGVVFSGCDCHNLAVVDGAGETTEWWIGYRSLLDHRGESFTLVDRVPEITDADILTIVHQGAFLMPAVVEDPQDGADILAFLREEFGE